MSADLKNRKYVIVNRAAPIAGDGWIHIVPKGELPNAEAGIVQVLDDVSLDAIMANIQKDRKSQGDKWPGIYAGEEHFIYDPEKSSAAFGWFKDFERRNDGIWANENGLTDIGQEAIKNKRFKFTSFVADPKDLAKISGNKFRILNVETVGFTNFANGKHLLTPITNRHAAEANEEFRPGNDATAGNTKRKTMKTVAAKLGLSAEASEETILAEVAKVLNRAVSAETELAPLKTKVTELETQNGALVDEQIVSDLDAKGIKDEKVRNRLTPVLKPMKNREERVTFLDECVQTPEKSGNGKGAQPQKKLFNRDTKAPEGKGAATEESDGKAEKVKADKIMNRANTIRKEMPNVSLPTAVSMAQREINAEN